MTEPTTCTVRVAADGTACGAPAVTTFTSARTGETFAECAEHDLTPSGTASTGAVVVGSRVRLVHVGLTKVGTVVAVTGGKARVEVPTAGGASRREVTRPVAELVLA